MNIDSAYSAYLKAADLPQGKRVLVRIQHVQVEEIGKNKDKKPVVYFEGKEKGLCLNKTNATAIKTIAGTPETESWVGLTVGLYATMVDFSGQQVPAIRVCAPGAKPVVQAPPPDADEVPWP